MNEPHPGHFLHHEQNDMNSDFPPRKTKIGIILDQPFLLGTPVERKAAALVEAGYEVHLLCLLRQSNGDFDETLPHNQREEAYRGIYIHRVNPAEVKLTIPFIHLPVQFLYQGWFKALFQQLYHVDTAWQALIKRFVRSYNIDVLHVYQLPLLSTGLAVAKHFGIKLVADLPENYPALMGLSSHQTSTQAEQKQYAYWERIENNHLSRCDHVFVSTEEDKERLATKAMPSLRSQNQLTVIPHSLDIERVSSSAASLETSRRLKTSFVLTYAGYLNDSYQGIQTTLEALNDLKEDIPEIYLVIAGPIRESYKARLQAMIEQYQLQPYVELTGWLNDASHHTYIAASDVCLCPHFINDYTESNLPESVYLYHHFKKPILASNCKPLARYIKQTQGGLTFNAGNRAEMAEKIKQLYANTELRKSLGEKGQQAIRTQYNWALNRHILVETYDRLTGFQRNTQAAPEPLLATAGC